MEITKIGTSIALRSCSELACIGLLLHAGCAAEPEPEQAATDATSIQIRFHESTETQAQRSGLLVGLAPIEYTDVTRILVDVTYADSGQPFALDLPLDKLPDGAWKGTLPLLPRNEQLHFAAEAFDAEDTIIFSGETLATLVLDCCNIEIPLAPAQDQQEFHMPQMYRIVYPSEITTGQDVWVIFTVEGNPGETIDYTITSADGSTPFSPAAGSITLGNSVADIVSLYTAPEVTDSARTFDYTVAITPAASLLSASIATTLTTTVVPPANGISLPAVPSPSVLFAPMILELEASETAVSDSIELTATVSDDSAAEDLSYAWSYEPNSGTKDITFLAPTSNPTVLPSYTVDLQGTIQLAVTDEDGGTTTLRYPLLPGQFTAYRPHHQ